MINFKKHFIAIIAMTAWLALILQLYILVNNTPDNGMTPGQAIGRFLIFFTVLTNLLIAISMTVLLFAPTSKAGHFFSKSSVIAAIALYIFIVGLIYNIILRSLWHPTGLQKIADELLHVAVPIFYLIYWVLFGNKSKLKWVYAFYWLIYPAVYLVYAMLRGNAEGFYPYPFLDLNTLATTKVFINCAGMLAVFIITGLIFIWIGRMMNDRIKSR